MKEYHAATCAVHHPGIDYRGCTCGIFPPADAGAVSEVEQRAKCEHRNRTGGNDYLECIDCGLMWDYRRENPHDAVIRNLLALVAELRQQQEQLAKDNEIANAILAEVRKRLDEAGIPKATGAVCNDSTCQTLTGHRVKVALAKAEAAEASLTALRGAQEQLQQQIAMLKQLLHESRAAEATGEAAVSQKDAEIERLRELVAKFSECASIWCPFEKRMHEAEQQLADRSAAIAQIVQEMRALSDPMLDGIDSSVREWADRLDAVGAERNQQTKEQEKW